MIRKLMFLLLFSPVLALECSNESIALLDSLPSELANSFEDQAYNAFYNVTDYTCFEQGINGTLLTKLFSNDSVGYSFFFEIINSTANFSQPVDYFFFEDYFTDDEISVLSPDLLLRIYDYESDGLRDCR